MLARPNRVVTADEFRAVVRRGRKTSSRSAVYYVLSTAGPARFGFIVSRAVGGSVVRNRLRRRYRAIGRALVDRGAHGADVVIRALPPAAELRWEALDDEVRAAVSPALSLP